jgi:hypothetical protein
VASYLVSADDDAGRLGQLRRALRRLFDAAGAPGHATESELHFIPWAGFVHLFRPGELEEIAAAAGYRVTLVDPLPYPHAVLVPED